MQRDNVYVYNLYSMVMWKTCLAIIFPVLDHFQQVYFVFFEGVKKEVPELIISNGRVSIQLSPIYNCQKIQERTKLRCSEIISGAGVSIISKN